MSLVHQQAEGELKGMGGTGKKEIIVSVHILAAPEVTPTAS